MAFLTAFFFIAFGLNPPLIPSTNAVPLGGVPNIIALPAGGSVPFHIQARDWRHLLEVLALSNRSRIEASFEALAATKQELKLRTVIQFFRVGVKSLL